MDKDEELARLEEAVYSRAGSAESAVDFIDPVTGGTIRATPSELRLRAFRAKRAKQTGLDARHLPARLPDAASADSESLSMPALAPGPTDAPSTPVASDSSAALPIFDLPTRYPDIPVPDLGDKFAAESIRNVSGTSLAEEGFGLYLCRVTRTGLFCLIVQTKDEITSSSCAAADEVTQDGLIFGTTLTVRSPVANDGTLGDNEVTVNLSASGDFSMTLSRRQFEHPGVTCRSCARSSVIEVSVAERDND